MKKLSLLLTMLLLSVGTLLAQKTVTGSITDSNGDPLIGASILVKGTSSGTLTDVDGSYSVSVPDGSSTLVVSYTGYVTQEVDVSATDRMDIVLEEGLELSEIVVTGLGIKREKKALGYGVSTISAASVANRQEADVARILRGKATGVDITQTSGLAGSGTNIIIRGYSSITGDNQPLFVVDGVPFNTSTNGDNSFVSGGATASSRFLDLDPNNIAEISILKGLSATVLYGEAGRNGVVLITTKNGAVGNNDADKGFEISFSQSVSQTEISNLPNYQNQFGNGFSGNFGWFFSNWGPSFDVRGSNGIDENGQIDHPLDQARYNDAFPEFKDVKYDYKSYEPTENFFDKGLTTNTSVNVAKRFANGAMNASYSYLTDGGFTPKKSDGSSSNQLNKHNFGLGATANLANGLTVKGTFNYVNSTRTTPPASVGFGSNPSGASVFANVVYTPRSVDLNNMPYQNPIDGSQVYYRRGSAIQNPLWGINNMFDDEELNRFFSTIDLNYEITDWLSAQYRLGLDQYVQKTYRGINRGGSQVPDGQMTSATRTNKIFDQVLNLLYNTQLTDDLELDGVVGLNVRRNNFERTSLFSSNQFVFDLFNHGNFTDHTGSSYMSDENTIGAYATASLGYKNFLYLNLQGRNDWTSTLEEENRSVFYPSASLSFVASDAIPALQSNTVLNYLKLRFGYGTSAGYPGVYQTRNTLNTNTSVFQSASGAVLNTNSVSNRLGNPNLAPELHTEMEFGLEGRFLQNRIGVDLSLYQKDSKDLIIDLELDPATGYTNTTVNAASLQNRGVEFGLNLIPVKGPVTWDMTLNFTKNENEVVSVADGVEQVVIAGYTTLGNFAIPGQPFGVIQGYPFEKNENGDRLVGANGEYIDGTEIEVIGDPNPNYTANWINSISFKGLTLGWQFSYIDGGDIYSMTTATMMARGLTEDTNVDRFLPIVVPGVLAADGTTPNDIQVYLGDVMFNAYFFADEGVIFDGTVLRLREAYLAYNLPSSILDRTPFGSASLTFAGENLWFNAPNFPEHVNFDPEVLSLGVGNGRGFDLITGPTAKKYGVTLNVTF